MNSRERVLAVLNFEEPDRVPWGEFAIDFDTVEHIIGRRSFLRAKARSRIAFWEGRRDEVVRSWRDDMIEMVRKLPSLDIVHVGAMASSVAPPRGYTPEAPEKIDENTWRYADGRVLKYSETTADLTLVEDPQMWTRRLSPEDFPAAPEVTPPDASVFEVIDPVIEAFRGERYILGRSGGEVAMVLPGGFERGLVEYAAHPELIDAASRSAVARANALDRFYVRDGQDAVCWGQGFAYKSGPFISPEMFRRHCLPGIKTRVEHLRREFGMPVFKHACGNNWKLMDMFVEAGYDSYMSIQPTAHMDLGEVKRKYGDRFVPWGGLPVELLVSGAPEEVKKAAKAALDSYKEGGGYIFGSSHSIAVGTKGDNFLAMLEAFEENRDC